MMTNTETAATVAEQVTAAIEEAFAGLVEIRGESKGARYTRLTRISTRLYNVQAGYQSWSDEHKALSTAAVRCHRFQMFGK